MIGCWMIGAKGNVASCTAALAGLLAGGRLSHGGLLTGTEPFCRLALAEPSGIVFGGHDVVNHTPGESFAAVMRAAGRPDLCGPAAEILRDYEGRIRSGWSAGEAAARKDVAAAEAPDALEADIRAFRDAHGLRRVVVVNLASTEPPCPDYADEKELAEAAAKGLLAESVLYAWAACRAGCAYVNFTPSAGARVRALRDLFARRGLPHAGRDGKTGETLVKAALAPLFRARALRVLSWVGFNILGNRDGATLRDPRNKTSKTASKGGVVPSILGYSPHGHVGIEYVPSLGDGKVAWDFVHFEGAFGVRMALQFVWDGVDSVLAAPLVLDLVRLVDLAVRRGEAGALKQTALFFKDPPRGVPHDLSAQFLLLENYAESVLEERS